jgi:hypothetical protein|tara:strand:- start:182 stop:448 length:267 start_codon:yes stop_codon:yes gene_type:complete
MIMQVIEKEITQKIYLIGTGFQIRELEIIAESLYTTDRDSQLLKDVNHLIKEGVAEIAKLQFPPKNNKPTEEQMLNANNGNCLTGDCD